MHTPKSFTQNLGGRTTVSLHQRGDAVDFLNGATCLVFFLQDTRSARSRALESTCFQTRS